MTSAVLALINCLVILFQVLNMTFLLKLSSLLGLQPSDAGNERLLTLNYHKIIKPA